MLLTALRERLGEAGNDRSRADRRGGAVLAEDEDEVDADVAVAPCWIQWVKTTRRTMAELAGKLSGRQDDGERGNRGGHDDDGLYERGKTMAARGKGGETI